LTVLFNLQSITANCVIVNKLILFYNLFCRSCWRQVCGFWASRLSRLLLECSVSQVRITLCFKNCAKL